MIYLWKLGNFPSPQPELKSYQFLHELPMDTDLAHQPPMIQRSSQKNDPSVLNIGENTTESSGLNHLAHVDPLDVDKDVPSGNLT